MITEFVVTVLTAHAAERHLPRSRASENHRYVVAADGTPFFWLGDTAWELFHRLNREAATHYLAGEPGQQWSIRMRSSRAATRTRNPQNRRMR
jgi:L-ascorbate metabolism protein UlaG (beta-lactamase superfamily)